MHGQASLSSISGTVTDKTGAAIAGAHVKVTNQGTNVSQQKTTTGGDGFYSIEGLTDGQYTIEVTKATLQENITRGIQLNPGQRRGNNVVLEVGSATAQVTVTADALQVNTESSERAGTISSEQIDNLMLNGRNFQTLAIAIPGVASTNGADGLGGRGLLGGTTLISGNMANIDILPVADGIIEQTYYRWHGQFGHLSVDQIKRMRDLEEENRKLRRLVAGLTLDLTLEKRS
jgi:hypothetical protein